LEDAVIDIGFEETAALGLIVSPREKARLLYYPLHGVANILDAISGAKLKHRWGRDAAAVGKATPMGHIFSIQYA